MSLDPNDFSFYFLSKWVFKLKTKLDGSIEHYKAKLVAKGYNQEYEIAYKEAFVPVAKIQLCTSSSVVAIHKWPIYQLDVKKRPF